ncbi:MAG: hypothetical protein ACRDS0_04985 [Pseudonocardiaceae bacterium]
MLIEEHTSLELAELFKITRPTVYRVLERSRARDSAAAQHGQSSALPADHRPLPDMASYDDLLSSSRQSAPETAAGSVPPPPRRRLTIADD